jgi:membrane protein DedA with SNARE-associated domain
MELVAHWISQYGCAGIFCLLVLGIVGLPVPDETLLTFAGYLVFRGQLHAVPTVASALAGSICGITLSYGLGRLTGYLLIEKYGSKLHVKMERVHRVHDWFRRLGRFTLTFGYFVPGVRHLTAYVAGASELEWPVFAGFAYPGGALWSGTFITLGYVLGEQWNRVSGEAHRYVLIVCAALAVAGLAYWVWRRRLPQADQLPPQKAD